MSIISMRLNLRLAVEHVKCSFKMPITRLQSLQRDFFTAYDGKLKLPTITRNRYKKVTCPPNIIGSTDAQSIQLKCPNLTQPYSFNKKSVTE